jgi:hypothetical protein
MEKKMEKMLDEMVTASIQNWIKGLLSKSKYAGDYVKVETAEDCKARELKAKEPVPKEIEVALDIYKELKEK